jgi:uncharacterized membrane protein (UPF0136 family)
MARTSVPCRTCKEPIYKGDDRCTSCGAGVDKDQKIKLQGLIREKKEMRRADESARAATVNRATRSLAENAMGLFALAVLRWYVLGSRAKAALAAMSGLPEDAHFTYRDADWVVGPLRAYLGSLALRSFVTWSIAAIAFGGLWAWSRKAPLPALVVGAVLNVAVWCFAYSLEPSAVWLLVVAFFSTALLVRGAFAVVRARRPARREPEPAA